LIECLGAVAEWRFVYLLFVCFSHEGQSSSVIESRLEEISFCLASLAEKGHNSKVFPIIVLIKGGLIYQIEVKLQLGMFLLEREEVKPTEKKGRAHTGCILFRK
jgi:hypothetical protein